MPKNEAQIKRTRNGQFRVNYFAANGESLANSEALTTIKNAKKNIVAMINISGGSRMIVIDTTGKTVKRFVIDGHGGIEK